MKHRFFAMGHAVGVLGAETKVDGFGPWHFGMSKDEVAGVAEFGSYKDVPATGGVETCDAQRDGAVVETPEIEVRYTAPQESLFWKE